MLRCETFNKERPMIDQRLRERLLQAQNIDEIDRLVLEVLKEVRRETDQIGYVGQGFNLVTT